MGSLNTPICPKYRFRQKGDILPQIVTEIFPTLVGIATQMMQTPPSASQEIPTMLHLILKTYKTSIVVNLSAHQQSAESLVPWGQLLFAVVNLQIPKDAVPEDEDDREKCEWWKAKKWAYGTLGRLFHRYVPDKFPYLRTMTEQNLQFRKPVSAPKYHAARVWRFRPTLCDHVCTRDPRYLSPPG